VSITIVNTTGNERGFEDDFCTHLASAVGGKIVDARGEKLLELSGQIDGSDVIVILAHGGNVDMHQAIVDTGLQSADFPDTVNAQLMSPIVLAQLLAGNTTRFHLVFCTCCTLSVHSISSALEVPSCIGTIASRTLISVHDAEPMAELLLLLESHENGTTSGMNVQKEVHNLVSKYKSMGKSCPELYFVEAGSLSDHQT
jgi:hypothetical protein